MNPLKILVAEDEFLSRTLLHTYLEPYGHCDLAANGREVLEAVHLAYEKGEPYDVIMLDIVMPELDGLSALKEIRAYEAKRGVSPSDGIKVIMATALGDAKTVMEAFKNQCEAYVAKPYSGDIIIAQLRKLGLIEQRS